ncbi:hypothetical protein [Stenotrophomonas sp. RG-453]|uniref:hypothetical protein n=1 Tax=Stenotrophomonas sp. RG-453 TaxID=2957502 RepID=UPI0029CA4945|nr:hypothetical protein [Stenotrophomonas sp. RG-453]
MAERLEASLSAYFRAWQNSFDRSRLARRGAQKHESVLGHLHHWLRLAIRQVIDFQALLKIVRPETRGALKVTDGLKSVPMPLSEVRPYPNAQGDA